MKLLMLCREPRLYSCQRLKQAIEARGDEVDILDPNRFILMLGHEILARYQPKECEASPSSLPIALPHYDGVIGRFGAGSTVMGCRVLHHYEARGIPTLNSAAAFALARDKWQSLVQLQAQGLPVPQTAISGELIGSEAVLADFPSSVVIKTLSGAQGVGVMLAERRSAAKSLLDTFHQAKLPVLTQTLVHEAVGQDIRVFVIGDRVAAAMLRQGQEGEFRANIHQGGRASAVELSAAEQQLAVRATQALGLMVAGVDLIRTAYGTLVLEVNASPGLEKIEQVSEVRIAEQMITYFISSFGA